MAFYRFLRDEFGAHALLHFGTHGALEFMPGKQTGLSEDCWPDRLIRDLPNFYLYAANNPSEGTLAKRRGAATIISYLTPPVTQAGLYRGLLDLKGSVQRWREFAPMLPRRSVKRSRRSSRRRLPRWIRRRRAGLAVRGGGRPHPRAHEQDP